MVCPTELVAVQAVYAELQEAGVEVYAVSVDSEYSHKAWADAVEDIGRIQYPMVADQTHALAEFFGVYNAKTGRSSRATFIVDPKGIIQAIEINNNPIGRSTEELIRKVKAAQLIEAHGDHVCPANWKLGDAGLKRK